MKKIITYIGFGSIWAALCAYTLTLLTMIYKHQQYVDLLHPLLLFTFGSTLAVYNAHNFFKVKTHTDSQRTSWNDNHLWFITLLGLVGLLMAVATVGYLHWGSLGIIAVLSSLTLLYSYPLLKIKQSRAALKNFGILKPILLSLVWTLVTITLPVVEFYIPLTKAILTEGFIRWIFILILCILFDTKDTLADSQNNIRTLPILLQNQLYRYLNWLAGIMAMLLFTAFIVFDFRVDFLIEALAFLLLFPIIRQVQKKQDELFYVLKIDGMMLLYSTALIAYHLYTLQ